MPQLDLTRFYGLDRPFLLDKPELFDQVRTDFAGEVIRFSKSCSTNKEIVDGLFESITPDSGLSYPRFMGNGSNRDVFLLPFSMVMKLERPWTFQDTRAAGKEGQYPFWYQNRRSSHFNELVFACIYPRTFVKVFGASLAFGHVVKRPAVLITERAAPFDTLIELGTDPDAILEGVDNSQMYIDPVTGELKVFDERFARRFRKREWTRFGYPMTAINDHGGKALSIRNIGLCQDGKVRIIDAGGIVPGAGMRLDENMLPTHVPWAACPDGSGAHVRQEDRVSESLMHSYRHFAALAEQKGGMPNASKDRYEKPKLHQRSAGQG